MTRTNRRCVLTGIIRVPLATYALSSPAKPVDPIVGWLEEWQVQEAIFDENCSDVSTIYEAAYTERNLIGLLICNATATSIEGASAQFEWLNADFGNILNNQLGGGFEDGFANIDRSLKSLTVLG